MGQGPVPPPAPAPLIFQDVPIAVAALVLNGQAAAPTLAPLPGPALAPAPAPVPPVLTLTQAVPFTQDQLDTYSCSNQDLPIPSVEQTDHVWWYRVSFLGGIALRSCPSVDAPRTGHMLHQNETFAVRERIQGTDGRLYLLLADYRGWAFDDSALMPHDPSVVRGRWSPIDAGASYSSTAHMMAFDQTLTAHSNEQSKRRRRRKRGGVKRNKNKRAQATAEAAALLGKNGMEFEEGDDADTDAPSEKDEITPLEADSSSCSGAEHEGMELFKEEDFPQLGSPIRN